MDINKHCLKYMILSSCLAASLPLGVMAADPQQASIAPPNAGTFLSELETNRIITPKPSKPVIDVSAPAQQKQQKQQTEMKARIDKVVFSCADKDVSPLLQPLATPVLHRDMTFADMQTLAEKATMRLRQEGYSMALVYVPVQGLQNNTLQLKALIGRYGDVAIRNTSSLMDNRVLGYTYPVRPGHLINGNQLDKSLLILNDIPGIQVKASMAPGKKADTAKIDLNVENLERYGGYVFVDNYGSRSSGRFRYGLDYHFNNVSHVGDQFDMTYLASTKGLHNYLFRYNIPVARDGAMARIAYSRMNYDLGGRYSYLHGDGWANTLELGITVPMKRTVNHSSFYDIAYRHRSLDDRLLDGVRSWRKSSDSIQGEIHGYTRTFKDSFSYSLSHLYGNIGMDNAIAQEQDTLRHVAGWYAHSNVNTYYIHQYNNRLQLHASVSGQYAWKNLDSSEQFYLGGADSVRAFPQGETGGDSGLLGTLEMRYLTSVPGLQMTAFIDAGRVFYNHDNLLGEGNNCRDLAGVGLGLIYSKYRDWYAKFDWATPWGSHYSSAEGNRVDNTYWFRVVKQF